MLTSFGPITSKAGSLMAEPKLFAEFRFSKDGEIRSYTRRYQHFYIRILIKDPPPGSQTVTYLLDPSYKEERILTIPLGVSDFHEDISSYGDYFITVSIEGFSDNRELFAMAFASKLSDALDMSYPAGSKLRTQEIQAAIYEIRKH